MYISEHYTEMDYSKYMAKIVILDEDNNVILNIEEFKHRDGGAPDVGGLFPEVHYVIDVDNDGVYEVISETPVWEGTDYILNRIDIDNRSILQSIYYTGM